MLAGDYKKVYGNQKAHNKLYKGGTCNCKHENVYSTIGVN